jgi:putative nucleotidyltransferase with HDIG domain
MLGRAVVLNLSSSSRKEIARLYVFTHVALGAAAMLASFSNWECHDVPRFLSFVVAATLASAMKVRLPGVTGLVSVGSLFVLIGIVNLSLSQTMVVGVASMLVQCTWRMTSRPRLVQVLFNVSGLATTIYITKVLLLYTQRHLPEPLSLVLVAVNYFCANTFPIASIIGLTEGKRILPIWREYRWMIPYYVVGASMAWLIGTVPIATQWEIPIICLPLVYLVHRSNRTHTHQVEQQNKHIVEMNALHLRTIEALALAIDAKDHTTHDHLQRVQLYAMEIGKDLGLTEVELNALRAAALLHDIGKLAVPESIISKPGKLTPSEFEKMKIHPVVGAEILERVRFPYAVAPIVRSHHEKWDGSGYPSGLRGTEIPIGARILAAVDCLDALASDRQYRRALPLDEAMARVVAEAGTAFDPAVVRALQARYQELEARAKAAPAEPQPSLSTDIKITRGSAPAAGFETEAPMPAADTRMHPVARARARRAPASKKIEVPALEDGALALEEALAVAALRIQTLVAHDAIAYFVCDGLVVSPKFAAGDDRRLLMALSIPRGEGLVGWVADNAKAILNGNPEVESGYAGSSDRAPSLASALALPLEYSGQTVGVLALYRNQKDAFAAHELVSLLPLCPALAALFAQHTTDLASLGASVSADSPALDVSSLNRELNGVGRHA